MTNENRNYLTVQFAVKSAIGERVLRIMPEDVLACISKDGIMAQANQILKDAGSEVRICWTHEDADGKWTTDIIQSFLPLLI